MLLNFKDIPYEIDEHIQVLCTPGPSQNAVSVLVGNSNLGTVAISGINIFYFFCIICFHILYLSELIH